MATLFKKNAFPKRIASRFTRSSGSVLILVIALLVLLALLGTAYISTTRVDRFASKQHTTNVEIDMLVEGVVNQVASAITSDIYDASGTYRPPDTFTLHNSNYDNYDAYGFTTPYDVRGQGQIVGQSTTVAHDAFLSQRFPWTLNPTRPFSRGKSARLVRSELSGSAEHEHHDVWLAVAIQFAGYVDDSRSLAAVRVRIMRRTLRRVPCRRTSPPSRGLFRR